MMVCSHSKLLLQFCPDGSPNTGHTATVLRTSAQIRQSQTLYVRKTLCDMPLYINFALEFKPQDLILELEPSNFKKV